jgi:glycosyltransferase involved in cell wall biosynthesis
MKISILMASYNCESYINEAIQSILNQTYDDWEIMIVDDGSEDNTDNVVSKYLNNKVRYYKQKHGGYASALKSAINLATGDVYGVLDSDDRLQTNALEVIAGEFVGSVGCVYSTYKLYSENWADEFFRPNDEMPCKFNKGKNSLTHSLHNVAHFKAFTKSAYDKCGGFDPDIKASVDKDIIYKLEEHTDLKFVNKHLYDQRIRNDSMTMTNIRNGVSKYWTIKVRSNAIRRRVENNRFDLLDNSVL